jgi:hypothetical protein
MSSPRVPVKSTTRPGAHRLGRVRGGADDRPDDQPDDQPDDRPDEDRTDAEPTDPSKPIAATGTNRLRWPSTVLGQAVVIAVVASVALVITVSVATRGLRDLQAGGPPTTVRVAGPTASTDPGGSSAKGGEAGHQPASPRAQPPTGPRPADPYAGQPPPALVGGRAMVGVPDLQKYCARHGWGAAQPAGQGSVNWICTLAANSPIRIEAVCQEQFRASFAAFYNGTDPDSWRCFE